MSGRVWGAIAAFVMTASPAAGQGLADFDYENLSFRGFGASLGYASPSAVDGTPVFGLRADLGFLGPGLRIVPNLGFWSSSMKDEEVAELEQSVQRLLEREQDPGVPTPNVDLGTIDRSDLVLGLDAHVVWRVRFGFLTYAGAGAAAHFLNGGGEAVDGTFVEDLLDSVTAGFNLHGGIEIPVRSWLRTYGEVRFEVLDDLYYPEFRVGVQLMTTGPAPGEVGP